MIYKELQVQLGSLYIICVLFLFYSCVDNKELPVSKEKALTTAISKDSVTLIPDKGLVYFHNAPFTGICVSYYSNGQLSTSREYLKGRSNGLYQKWFSSGIKSFESSYRNGRLNGVTTSWWGNSNLRTKSNYLKGVAQGKQVQWYRSGAKFKQMNMVDGKEEGIQQSWRENGKLYNNYEAKNGRIFGLKKSTLCYKIDDEEVQY